VPPVSARRTPTFDPVSFFLVSHPTRMDQIRFADPRFAHSPPFIGYTCRYFRFLLPSFSATLLWYGISHHYTIRPLPFLPSPIFVPLLTCGEKTEQTLRCCNVNCIYCLVRCSCPAACACFDFNFSQPPCCVPNSSERRRPRIAFPSNLLPLLTPPPLHSPTRAPPMSPKSRLVLVLDAPPPGSSRSLTPMFRSWWASRAQG
jgi:hypothetical protein